jgi:ATP/maltotriose-dependent transcriptional regulator MalT
MSQLRRSLAFVALALLALVSLMEARAVFEARAQLARAQPALVAGDFSRAVSHLRLAARWDAPGNVYAQRAMASLDALALAAEQRGDAALALRAYRALHAAVHASRGIRIREPGLLARADARIAALMAKEPAAARDAGLSEPERARRYLALLQLKAPRTLGVLLACSGFFVWVLAFAALVLRGLDDQGRIVKAVARPSFLCLVFGWVAFAVGLHLA